MRLTRGVPRKRGKRIVIEKQQPEIQYTVDGHPVSRQAAAVLTKYYPATADGRILVPQHALRGAFYTAAPRYSDCVYRAVEEYCGSLLGIGLSSEDADWVRSHPLAQDAGLPAEAVPSVVQGLLEPYGLGISRIVVSGYLTHPLWRTWEKALGVNPFYKGGLTNEQAAKRLNVEERTVNEAYRFAIAKDPLRPSVLSYSHWVSNVIGFTGEEPAGTLGGFGHTVYLPPRGRVTGEWQVSLQIDRLERIRYYAPPELPEYTPRPERLVFNEEAILLPNGQPLRTALPRPAYEAYGLPDWL